MPTMIPEPLSEEAKKMLRQYAQHMLLHIGKANGRDLVDLLSNCDDETLRQAEMSISIELRERHMQVPPYAHNDD